MRTSKSKPFLVLFVIPALALVLLVAQLSAQGSPVVPDIGFEIEGNTALDNGGDYDWETADFPPAALIQDPNSKAATDPTTFRPNSKFDNPGKWSVVPGQVGPGQNELTNVLTWFILPDDLGGGRPEDVWLVLGMERTKQEGTFDLDFEFNQVPWDGSSGGPDRTSGDLAVGFELKGNPTDRQKDLQVLIIQYLPGDQPSLCAVTPGKGNDPAQVEVGDEPCPPYGDSGWYYRILSDGAILADSGLGQATMNEEPFPVPDWWESTDAQGNPRSEIGPFQFAEAALNLTELGIEATCSTFSTVHAKSRSSLEVKSDLKDLAGPIPLEIMCRLDGHKFLDVNGDGLWDKPDEPPLEGWEIGLNDGSVTYTDQEGYYAFEGLKDGSYTVKEECPPDWVQSAPEFTDFETCGDAVHTADIHLHNREVNDLDFGNGRPALDLDKTCTSDVFVGDDISYEIRVANTGNVLLEGILVEDPFIGLNETIDLAPGESEVFSGEYSSIRLTGRRSGGQNQIFLPLIVRGSGADRVGHAPQADEFTNTATATSEYALATVTASDTCVTNVHELEVSKDARPSLERQYYWTLDKTVDDPGPHGLYPGDFAQVEYTITAGLADPPFADRKWAVEGTIRIDNPAPMDAVLDSVSDVVSPNFVASVNCPLPLKVPKLGSLICTYGPVSLPDATTRTNRATATLVNNNGGTTDFGGTAVVDFEQASIDGIDTEARVTDYLLDLDQTIDFGTVRYDETPAIFTRPRTFTATGAFCELMVITNTAKLVTIDTSTTMEQDARVDLFEICTLTVAYEDLPADQGNDWDYNDLVIEISPRLEVSANHDLLAVELLVVQEQGAGPTPDPPMTAFTHTFHLQPYEDSFTCDGKYTLTSKTDGVTTVQSGDYTRGDDFLVIPATDAPPDSVELRIDFDVPDTGCPFDFSDMDPIGQYHGQWLFFNPWILVNNTSEPIRVKLGTGECECRILTIPVDWQWPAPDGTPVWVPYPKVSPPDPNVPESGPVFVPLWWQTP